MGEDKQTSKYRRWTKEEMDFIIKNYRKMTAKQMSLKMGRSVHAIHLKSGDMRIREKPTPSPPPKEGNNVIWRKSPYEGYWVTDTGLVWSTTRATYVKPFKTDSVIYSVQLKVDKQKLISVGRLVWETFKGPLPEGYVIAFKDRNDTHCDLPNLMILKRGDMMKMGYSTRKWIVQTDKFGNRVHVYPTYVACARKLGVSEATIRGVLSGRSSRKLQGVNLKIVHRPSVEKVRRKAS